MHTYIHTYIQNIVVIHAFFSQLQLQLHSANHSITNEYIYIYRILLPIKVPAMVGCKEYFCKIQTSKTAILLIFSEFFNSLL